MVRLRRKLTGRSKGTETDPVEDVNDDGTEETQETEGTDGSDGTDEASYDDAPAVDGAAPVPETPAEPAAEDAEPAEVSDDTEPAESSEDTEPAEELDDDLPVDENPVVEKPRRGLRGSVLLSLVQAAHIKQAVVTALVVGGVGAVAGRSAREVGVVILTVLVGQVILGWHNDITDRARDERQNIPNKPLADGRLDPGTVWYAIVVAALILVPLAVTTGITAGCLYLASVAVGMLGNVALRTGVLSWWSWAASYALLPYYLSYGGWGGQAVGPPPEPAIVVLAALLGIGVHFMRAVWGLVADHEEGWTYLPLRIALKVGATRLLAIATTYSVLVVVAMLIVGMKVGLSR